MSGQQQIDYSQFLSELNAGGVQQGGDPGESHPGTACGWLSVSDYRPGDPGLIGDLVEHNVR